MNKTLTDLLRLLILVNLIILAFYTLPQSEPIASATAVAKRPLAAQAVVITEDGRAPSPQTSRKFYLQISARHEE